MLEYFLDAFMDQISRDAEKRYQDRLERTERMETLKKRANLAYKRGEYEKALVLYTKVFATHIDQHFTHVSDILGN